MIYFSFISILITDKYDLKSSRKHTGDRAREESLVGCQIQLQTCLHPEKW